MEDRKKDHLNLALTARVNAAAADAHFNYEPLLSAHPHAAPVPFSFAGKTMRLPVWVSSMTGGTDHAGVINRRLAAVCRTYGMGMGLGSCRALLDNDTHLADFDVRDLLGDEQPLYANLGICQLEKLILGNRLSQIDALVHQLRADGIIIHINPLQEAFQPEGDQLHHAPIDLLEALMEKTNLRVIVKEVGQGMGPESLRRLLQLPLQAIEFGALGGTNFSLLELIRHNNQDAGVLQSFANVGHTAEEMLEMINQILLSNQAAHFPQLIISGGITSPLHGYRLVKSSTLPAVYGMGALFLQHARAGENELECFVDDIQKAWMLCDAFLKVK
jgi:isopentenyl-diphosphate delta-isomerase